MQIQLSLELLRVVEQAAIASARTMGTGDRHMADQAATETMRRVMDQVPMDGTVVIGEGEKDEAPISVHRRTHWHRAPAARRRGGGSGRRHDAAGDGAAECRLGRGAGRAWHAVRRARHVLYGQASGWSGWQRCVRARIERRGQPARTGEGQGRAR